MAGERGRQAMQTRESVPILLCTGAGRAPEAAGDPRAIAISVRAGQEFLRAV